MYQRRSMSVSHAPPPPPPPRPPGSEAAAAPQMPRALPPSQPLPPTAAGFQFFAPGFSDNYIMSGRASTGSRSSSTSSPIIPPKSPIDMSATTTSTSTTTSATSGTAPQVVYRRHSRKRSSQVLIPALQPRRRSSAETSSKDEESGGSSSADGETLNNDTGDIDDAGYFDSNGVFVDNVVRKKSIVTGGTFASGATFLIGAQFFSKLVTFGLNQALLRFVDPELFGASAQLEMLVNAILYFSREAVRLAAQRQTLSGKKPDPYRFEGGVVEGTVSGTTQLVLNIGFVPLFLGIPLAASLAAVYYYNSAVSSAPYLGTAIILIAVSAVVELASEPCFVLAQLYFDFRKRASFESIAITVRCILTFILVILSRRSNASIIAFGFGQLAYSTVLAGLYITYGLSNSRHKKYKVVAIQGVWREDSEGPTGKPDKIYFSPDSKALAQSMLVQTFFKWGLSEGDKLLVGFLLSVKDQGIYAVVLNYGSLLARLLFLPVEETLRNVFSKLLASPVSQKDANTSVTVLSSVLRLYSYLSIFALIFGPACAPYLLQFLVSRTWYQTDAPRVLAVYTCYIPFLALNGALESFVQSVATPSDMKRQGAYMFVFFGIFSLSAYVLMSPQGMDLGASGLVYANMINMLLRIVWCVRFISNYYSGLNLTTITSRQWLRLSSPSKLVWSAAAACEAWVWWYGTVASMHQLLQHVTAAVAMLAIMAYCEPELVDQALSLVKARVLKQRRASNPVNKAAAVSATTVVEEKDEEIS